MFVREIMSQPVITVEVGATLDAVARRMWENDCGTMPVVDTAGRLAGIVTDRDVCMAAYTQGKPLKSIPLKSAMAREVFSLSLDDSVSQAEKLMATKRVRRLPVVNVKGQPVGIVSLNDLVRDAAGGKEAEKKGIGGKEVLRTMAAIGEPRRPKVLQA